MKISKVEDRLSRLKCGIAPLFRYTLHDPFLTPRMMKKLRKIHRIHVQFFYNASTWLVLLSSSLFTIIHAVRSIVKT